ncbi:MAG TPA: hypothetical protein VER98_12825 [Terriglobia bacterium]|nr:hypothetical protein [Terriglobia bacterium]
MRGNSLLQKLPVWIETSRSSRWLPSKMDWAEPQYSHSKVDKAGDVIRNFPNSTIDVEDPLVVQAIEVMVDWREAHIFPMAKLRENAEAKLKTINPSSLVFHRAKRAISIGQKLWREKMRLSQMQDIGGVRVVLDSVAEVRELENALRSDMPDHEIVTTDDYILTPKPSGYRSLHLITKYRADGPWKGLWVELQVRSRLQHTWATALETVETFTKQALKASQGNDDWLRFFALMGAVIALREECGSVPDTPSGLDLMTEIRFYAKKLDVLTRLRHWRVAVGLPNTSVVTPDDTYFLLRLDTRNEKVIVTGYTSTDLEEANRDYAAAEQEAQQLGYEVVLVAAETLNSLREGYPNYFADTDEFIQCVMEAINEQPIIKNE